MKRRKRKIAPLLVIIGGLVLVFVAIAVCSVNIKKNLQNEMKDTLRDIATQNVLAVNNEISAQYKMLQALAGKFQSHPEQERELLKEMDSFVEAYNFKRMGYVRGDGKGYTTDGYTADFQDRRFFQKSMEGKIWLSDAQEDRIEGGSDQINVFSVPVYDAENKEVQGVIFATYRNEIFQKILDVDFLDGQGYSCIIKTDGEVIVHSQNSPIADEENFLQHIAGEGGQNFAVIKDMTDTIEAGGKGFGRCDHVHEKSASAIFYYMPMHEEQYNTRWYMLTIVPTDVLAKRMEPVLQNVRIFACVMMIVASLGMGYYFYMGRRRREELESLAYQDRLTGGYNFASFRDKSKYRDELSGYVIAMDVVEFKMINSNFGVQKGDETLLEMWRIFRSDISETEMVARVNADRFVLFLQAQSREALEKRLDNLCLQIEEISGRLNIPLLFPVFGIYYAEKLDEPDKYYGNAVQAKHLVKGRRNRHYAYYDEIDHQQLLEERELEDSFVEALEQRQFEVWYQPKYSTKEGRAIGAEALVRWRRADGSLLSPGKFIPLFEKNGNIAVLDEYIFRRVCEQQKAWLDQGYQALPVSVNISRISLYFENIVENYQKILEDCGLESRYVQLEITESATIDNEDIADLIDRFHQAGFEVLLDDFGSGYSSLASLNTLHFDTMKLDKSLIDYIGDENGEKLLTYITKLGQSLGLRITAEGVETESQLSFLRTLSCDDIQGYYFSKPLSKEDYSEKIRGDS